LIKVTSLTKQKSEQLFSAAGYIINK